MEEILKTAANILNNMSRTGDKGWPSSLDVAWGTNNLAS
jgi:hypothetical protein